MLNRRQKKKDPWLTQPRATVIEVLRTVALINKRFEEIIELQRQQDLAIFYLRGVLDAKDQVL